MMIEKEKIIKELYLESTIEVMNSEYKCGIIKNILISLKMIIAKSVGEILIEKDTVAIVFFKNELESALRHKKNISEYQILKLEPHNLKWIIDECGWIKVLGWIKSFIKLSVKEFGVTSLLKFAHPMCGWLIYNYFIFYFKQKKIKEVVVFNLLHPSSLGVYFASLNSKIKIKFCEHAATPRIALNRNLYFDEYFIFHKHTKKLFIDFILKDVNIKILHEDEKKTLNHFNGIKKIGYCINSLDKIDTINLVLSALYDNGFDVICRVHDSDRRFNIIKRMAKLRNFSLESAANSKVDDFFKCIDLVVAGNSNVVGDAVRCNIPIIYYWDGVEDLRDLYGLVDYYNVSNFKDITAFSKFLKLIK